MSDGAAAPHDLQPLSQLPDGWRLVSTSGPPGFVTHAVLRRPDGSEVQWDSRRHRKGLGLRSSGRSGAGRSRRGRPDATAWWLGGLFAVGSLCFAVASLPVFFDRASPAVVAGTFFLGSLFFTSAGYLQYHETLRAPTGVTPDAPRPRRLRTFVGWHPRRIDWWASIVQLAGTLFFNVSTFAATRADLSVDQARRLIWAPDVGGSICFLVASALAYSEVNHGILPRSDRSVGWRISALNLTGSIAFGVAALASRYLRTTGEPANIALVNVGTFAGAACFLVGAALLPVESARAQG